jgi:hypothetical protein
MSAALLVSSLAHGAMSLDFYSCQSLENLGSYNGTMTWSYAGGSSGTLSVTLNNTSNAANGGFLTGFGFNAAPTTLGGALTTGLPEWSYLENEPASPYENFDFGAATEGSFLGGGQPAFGVAAGASFTFVFTFSGDAGVLAGLDANSFFDDSAPAGYGFIARFRGFDNGGSDKVIACLEPNAVPVPMPVALAAAGLLGVGVLRRRMK